MMVCPIAGALTPRVCLQVYVLRASHNHTTKICSWSMQYQPPAKTQAPVPDGTVGVAPSDLKVMVADTPTDPATHGQVWIWSLT